MTPSDPVLSPETLATLRHDLRTPLNHIIGYSDMLLEDAEAAGQSEMVRQLGEIRTTAKQLVGLIQNALSPSRPSIAESDVRALRRALANPLNRIIREASGLVQLSSDQTVADLLKIGQAAISLLAFTEGAPTPTPGVASTLTTAPTKAQPLATGNLLVVDDDERNRDVLGRQLERQGYRVKAVEDGPTALQILAKGGYDLVLLDVMMPGMDGLQVLERMKADEHLREYPVVMISALDEVQSVARCIEQGADDYLFKPFDPVLLRARISSSLERKRLRDEERKRTEELERSNRQLESAERELMRSNQELQRFAYAASHDLQEPLRMVISYLQLLRRRVGSQLDPDGAEFLHYAEDGARRMNQLIDDLLTYARATMQEQKLSPTDTNTVLAEVLATLQAAVEENQGEVRYGELPTVCADSVQIGRVFQNLISNALKYRREEPPRVDIRAVRREKEWEFAVRDNGLGIAAEDIPKMFQFFQRLHGHDKPGTGIGLATCRSIVERLGGRIWVESQAGEGSTFFFTVPIRPSC